MFASSFFQERLFFLGETLQSLSFTEASADSEPSRQGGSSAEVKRLLISAEEVPVMIKTCFQYFMGMSVLSEKLMAQIHPATIHKALLSFWCPGGR